MRGFLFTALSVLVAIAIGVAVEPVPSESALPGPLARALAATMAVRSIEIRTSFPGATTPAVYQAPDRWEGPVSPATSSGDGGTTTMRPVIVGNWEYETLAGSSRRPGAFAFLRTRPQHLGTPLGVPPAQNVAFGPLLDARLGHHFRRHAATWTYRAHLGGRGTFVTGGSVTVAHGLVQSATIVENAAGHRLVVRSAYADANRAPQVPTPPQARAGD